MLCKECVENIPEGDACMTEPSANPHRLDYFHPECHSRWLRKQRVNGTPELRLMTYEEAARMVH